MAAKKKEEAKAAAGLGVIATILDIITTKGPINRENILQALAKKFPDRELDKMASTVKAQIGGKARPLSMEKEKKVKFFISDDGEFSVKGGKK